jgi:putative sterol carrier protein
MSDATAGFFEGLEQRGHEPLLDKVKGTVRFELTNGKTTKRWFIALDHCDIAVSQKTGKADCTARMPEALFKDIVSGRENAMAAFLRGAVAVEGDPELLILLQRLFPGPQQPTRKRGKE